MQEKNYNLFQELCGLGFCCLSDEWIEIVENLEAEPVLILEENGFRFEFKNGFYLRLYLFLGALFGTLKDETSRNTRQLHSKKAREVFDRVIDDLLAL